MASTTRTLVQAGLTTALVDFAFASVQTVLMGGTFERLWKGVASVPLGPDALNGGTGMVVAGLGLHVVTAFWWSAMFLFVVSRLGFVRRMLAWRWGVAKVAAVYGPCVYLAMSLVAIPLMTGRPPAFTVRWLVQLIGHAPFVGWPIVGTVSALRADS